MEKLIFNQANKQMDFSFETLESQLLSIGGIRVVGDFDEDIKHLLTRGEIFSPKKVKSVKMKPNRCHANSGVFWKNFSDANGLDNVQIVAGWCLSEDGLWRQHSFIYQPIDNIIIETTVKRKIYFGFVLNLKESNIFYENNY